MYFLNPSIRAEKEPRLILENKPYGSYLFQSKAFFDLLQNRPENQGQEILGISLSEQALNIYFEPKELEKTND